MIIRADDIKMHRGRRPYDLGRRDVAVRHFVTRVTTPDTPFGPHKHDARELWFILEGEAIVSLDGVEHLVHAEDLVVIDPRIDHGLRTDSEARWICLG